MPRLITIKDCVSQASLEIGIAQKPVGSAINSLDADITQMVALLGAVAGEVLLEEPYRRSLGDEVWLSDSDGAPRDAPLADDDVILFDARLAIDGLKYRFLKAKGLEFGEEQRDFIVRLNKLAGRVNGRVLDLERDDGRVI
jgi:hypothetical protein